jgi:hypothetical protein
MNDMELAEEIERRWNRWNGKDEREADLRQFLFANARQIIAALRRADLAQTEIKGHMRVVDDLQGRIAELEKDAARYKWLREARDEQQPVVTIAKQNSWGNWQDIPLWDEELDAAIDAALKDRA